MTPVAGTGVGLALILAVLGSGAAHAATSSTEPSPRELALAREAKALYEAGKHEGAAARFLEVLRLRESATSSDDPSLIPALRALSLIRAAQGRRADALALMRRALPLAEQAIIRARAAFSESRTAALLEYLRVDEEIAYSLLADPAAPVLLGSLHRRRPLGPRIRAAGRSMTAAARRAAL